MENNQNLQKRMATRHITMIALGGAIGAGLFKGSASAIESAGPAVLLSYFIRRRGFILCDEELRKISSQLG